MNASPKRPGISYILAAIAIAVAVWLVMGTPESSSAGRQLAIARSGLTHH